MVLRKEITARIKEVLGKHPEGLSITDLVRSVDINRNTAGRYLESLLHSGQVEMRRFGMSKMYTLAKRLPVASALSLSSELVFQLDTSQRVIYANDPLLSFLGVPGKTLLGKNIEFTPFSMVFEDVFDGLLDRFRRGLRGEEWRGELSHPVRERYFICRVTPAVFSEGTKGVSIFLEDITSRKRDGELIRMSEARLRSIFMVSPIGIGVISGRTFQEVNDRFCDMTGYTAHELVGRSTRMLYATEDAYRIAGGAYMSQIRETGSGSIETQWERKDGTVIDVILNTTPLDPANISGGITFAALDITGRKRSEEALRMSEERLNLALSASETGLWEMEFPPGRGAVDENAAAILGYDKSEIGKLREDWDSLTHPEDVPGIAERIADCLAGRTIMFESEHRMRHRAGHWVWVLGRGKVTFTSPDGKQKRISGTLKDISARKRAEQELRDSEEKYRALVEQSVLGLIIVQDDAPVYANPVIRNVTGYSPEEFLALGAEGMIATVHPDDRDRIRAVMQDRIEGHAISKDDEFRVVGKDNTARWVLARGIQITYRGRPAEQVTYFDITERKTAEHALRESEQRLAASQRLAKLGDVSLDIGTGKVTWSQGMYDLLQYDPSVEIDGAINTQIHYPDDRGRLKKWLQDALASGEQEIPPIEYRLIRKDGNVLIVHTSGEIERIDGKPVRAFVTLQDITERTQAEKALRESEEKYRNLVEQSLQGLTIIQNGRHVYANQAMLEIWGYEAGEYFSMGPENLFAGVHPDDREKVVAIATGTLEGQNRTGSVEFRFVRRDGGIRWILGNGSRITYNGQPATQVVFFDLTNHKLAEKALRESEDRYRKLVEISPNGILLHRDGKIIYANSTMAQLLGVEKPEDLRGGEVFDLIHPAYREAVRNNIARDLSGESSPFTELQLIRSDGTTVFAEGQGVGTVIDGRPAVLVTIADITERHRTETALRESEERYRTLAEASQDIIFVIGKDDRVEYVNSYAATMVGLPADQVTGKPRASLFTGEPGARQFQTLRRVFETGKPGRSEGPMRVAGSLRWFDHFLMPVTDPQGTVTSVLGVSRDISDRKQAEEACRSNEERYRVLIEQTFDAMAVHKNGKIAFLNERAARILGAATPEDLTGKAITDLIHPDSRRDLEERLQAMARDPAKPAPVLREKFFRTDGSVVTVDVMAVRSLENGQPAVKVWFREVPG